MSVDVYSLTAATRAVHFAAAVGLFGEFVFRSLIDAPGAARLRPRIDIAAAWLTMLVASGAVWLVIEATTMSGLPIGTALQPATLRVVVTQTLFGAVWSVRLALAAVLGVALAIDPAGRGRGRWRRGGATLLAGALLVSLAWVGHANAERGIDRFVHRAADALHLLAVGGWVGALVPLIVALGRTNEAADARSFAATATIVERFSTLGIVCVLTIVASGVVNAWYTVGDVSHLIDTRYGRLLTVKLCLFVPMVVLAAYNRSQHAAAARRRAHDKRRARPRRAAPAPQRADRRRAGAGDDRGRRRARHHAARDDG